MLKKIPCFFLILNFLLLSKVQGAESGGMPQLDPEFWISQIFWLVLTFSTLFLVLTKIILPKIGNNLESRKSQIIENIETAEKQRVDSEKKIKEYDDLINKSKSQAKNLYNEARQRLTDDINKKKEVLAKEIDEEIKSAEKEINSLKENSYEKINKIAIETSADILKQLINTEVNNSNISAIVEDLSKKNKEKSRDI